MSEDSCEENADERRVPSKFERCEEWDESDTILPAEALPSTSKTELFLKNIGISLLFPINFHQ